MLIGRPSVYLCNTSNLKCTVIWESIKKETKLYNLFYTINIIYSLHIIWLRVVESLMMDNCFIDITIEFLCIAFHNILYYTSVYPQAIFESRRKYNVVVYRSIHPEVNQYIDLCLKHISECLKNNQLSCVEFAVTDSDYESKLKFVFQFDRNNYYDETIDSYLIQAEQNLRAFCLKLASVSYKFKDLGKDLSFKVYIHTNESTAVSIAANPVLEEFPLVETEDNQGKMDKIIPLRRFSVKSYFIDTFIELE